MHVQMTSRPKTLVHKITVRINNDPALIAVRSSDTPDRHHRVPIQRHTTLRRVDDIHAHAPFIRLSQFSKCPNCRCGSALASNHATQVVSSSRQLNVRDVSSVSFSNGHIIRAVCQRLGNHFNDVA
ncbi:uncharacterized protein METZ01_LOCUS74041 [marine metagenome]|uniref:Uncharacterized protein n=1 Tax=marine metagenome TaxID=408172 RepID=A0A381U1P7_9ZZZZ